MNEARALLDRLVAVLTEPSVLLALALGSAVMFGLSLIGVPWFVARLPADYFSGRKRRALGMGARRIRGTRLLLVILKNLVGGFLLFVGVLMLFLPGQGLLTIVAALALLDFPGKHRLQRRLVAWPPVLNALNALRRRADRPPLVVDAPSPPPKPGTR
jgi:hypothetical protein